jgi:hypothetical protein
MGTREVPGETLLDRILPDWEFGNRHAISVPAPRDKVYAAALAYRLDDSWIVRALFRMRGLGRPPGNYRDAMRWAGFAVLAEEPNRELVLGIAGRFWAIRERQNLLRTPDEAAFRAFNEPGCAKAAMNFRVEDEADGRTRLLTETRVQCLDRAALRSFRLYWTAIGPFSGLIRRVMLGGIAREAERGAKSTARGTRA